jgi:hypothetical protein
MTGWNDRRKIASQRALAMTEEAMTEEAMTEEAMTEERDG